MSIEVGSGPGVRGYGLSRFVSSASFTRPDYVVDSTWLAHAPFAFWLVDAMRPGRVVELGIYKGFSYFVFCQAADAAGSGVCVGVDTWLGDDQSGHFGPDVYEVVLEHNALYADRSTLLCMQFQEALSQVEPGSVDLLHIDGCHRYDDVRRDFETWVDRMSPRGVVLFHDTRERTEGFGVWRLWEELTATNPSFEFFHEHGLGVLALGDAVSSPIADLCAVDPDSPLAGEIRHAYSELGSRVADALAIRALETTMADRERALQAEAIEASKEAAERERELQAEAIEASREAYKARWELDRVEAQAQWVSPSVEIGPTLLRGAKAVSQFLQGHPRAAQVMRGVARTARRVRVPPSAQPGDHDYQAWIDRYDTIGEGERGVAGALVEHLGSQRRFSIVMPVCDPPLSFLNAAVASVEQQIYPGWELVIVDDCSADPAVQRALEELDRREERVTVVRHETRAGISAALNTGVEHSQGEFVAFLDHDDVLTCDALLIVALRLERQPGVAFVYSDEDALDATGRRVDPYFKPDWDPSLLLGQNFVCHLLVCRREIILAVGGFRSEFDGAQDWDLVLRMAEHVASDDIAHIPHVLYHWRRHAGSTSSGVAAKPYAVSAGRRAVEEALRRRAVSATPVSLTNGWNRIVYDLPPEAPSVAVVVPTGLAHPFVGLCLDGLLFGTDYPNLTVVLVADERALEENGQRLSKATHEHPRVKVLAYEQDVAFNFSRAVNLGVAAVDTKLVCLLNDDVVVADESWLSALVARTLQPGVGATGALLCYPNETIQHGGVILGLGDVALAYHEGLSLGQPGYCGRALLDQDLSCVTAACMVVRRDLYHELGGFDESFEISFNDVDFCLRLREAGWRILWTPEARLYHAESTSVRQIPGRVPQYKDEARRMWTRWAPVLSADPFYNPNLSLSSMNELAWPPRVSRPTREPDS